MHIKSKLFSILFKLILVLIGTTGLLEQFGIFDKSFKLDVLNYFTVLSNLLCVVYFIADMVYATKNMNNQVKTTWCPVLKGITIMGVTITMLVAHFVLGMSFSTGSMSGLSLLAVHYIVPIMSICDWLLFDKKGQIRGTAPIIWMIAPLFYFVYAMISAQIGEGVGYNSKYPYPFIDVDRFGWGKVLGTVFFLVVVFIALGYCYYAMDRLLYSLETKKHKNKSMEPFN